MKTHFAHQALFIALSGLVLTGCHKKEEATEAAAPPTNAPAESAPAQPAVSGAITPPAIQGDLRSALDQQEKALKQNDFEAATDAALRAESAPPRTAQEAFDRVNRMRDLQKRIADAAAAGDPRAQRAADLLRRYYQARQGMGGR